ncbi:MAG TPA: discoidin domain-containing protein [Nitrososphaeraceae archaeon]|nr:discoidin domain-containing protein [Nitrososphaeraceae archaeon]
MRGNLAKLALSNHLRSNQLKIGISIVSFLILIFTNPLVQPSQVYGQSDPITTPNTCSKLPVSGITASGSDSVNPPSHAIDQNLNTRWSNLGFGSWIQIDLGQENVICTVGLNWHRGNERVNTFVISISKDGKTFTNAYSGKSDGTSLTEQKYNLQSQTGRFVRVMVNGNTQSNWISISESKIYGYKGSSESCINSQLSQATASAPSSQSGFPSSKAVDNNLNTVWSNYGVGSSIQLDLGSSKNICSVDIAWYKGNERQNNFIVSTSQDGKSFKTVISTVSSGKSLSYEKYNVVDTNARYIRIAVNGNNQNNYASISEIKTMVSSSSGQSQVQCVDGHIHNAKTSASQTGFPGTNVLDDNLETRWSNNGVGSWIQLDLGTSNEVCDISIAWFKGNERQNNFVISTSNDGIKFSNVLSSKSTGSTLDPEKYDITDTNARYIRITVNGNTLNSYASITEVSINIVSISGSSNYYIGAAGDWGSSRNDNWEQTVDLMIDNKINLALGLGDYSYGSVDEFEPIVDELKNAGIPMKGAKGDHDSNSYAELFGQPSMVHAFDAGDARIIMLDSYRSPSSNVAFLEKELQATKQPWKIVVTNTPLYTSPSVHDPDESQTKTKDLQPLLDKYAVDLVMWGDNHNYERIKFPDKHTVFIQSGTAGRSHYEFDGQIEESVYQNDEDYGFTKILITQSSIMGQFISHSGKILDNFSITK